MKVFVRVLWISRQNKANHDPCVLTLLINKLWCRVNALFAIITKAGWEYAGVIDGFRFSWLFQNNAEYVLEIYRDFRTNLKTTGSYHNIEILKAPNWRLKN